MATYNGHNEDASGNILLSIGNGMTATLETGTTASQAYTKGAYLYYNNRLCKVTAAIASGNTLTIGTNIAYTSLGAELTSHLKATNGDEFYFDYKDGEPGYYPSASKTASQFVPLGGTEIDLDRYVPNNGNLAKYNSSSPSDPSTNSLTLDSNYRGAVIGNCKNKTSIQLVTVERLWAIGIRSDNTCETLYVTAGQTKSVSAYDYFIGSAWGGGTIKLS